MTLSPFSFKLSAQVVFDVGCVSKLPGFLEAKGLKNVLLVSDRGLEEAGMVGKVTEILKSSGINYVAFLDVEANPSTETVEKGAELFRENQLEGIVCFGGGSPIDTAKAIAVLGTNGGKTLDYKGAYTSKNPAAPIIAIPTTAGTGSEVTPFAVITDRSQNFKFGVVSPELLPQVVVLDPLMISTLPPLVAASTGMDALTHAIESYLSLKASPFSDSMGEKAMELIFKNIRSFVANRADIEAASGMLLGSLFAGIAFGAGMLGNVHAMAHPLGGHFNIAHGIANAVLLPTVLKYNALADKGKYEKIYSYLKDGKVNSVFTSDILVNEIRQLSHDIGIPLRLSELGVKPELIPDMAQDAIKGGLTMTNPRQTTLNDVEKLYHEAM